ncbi:tripartite motif-containing protein 43-like [Dipodomys spectabilis]|uniref:tripartite motif-containing protein 43-like n=1 Tax=Dipodomys spectabilis TaxID=105255 RepID=UPI001C53E0E2|nr:tripartite motif-containing protein 43-like [Dipodomys spectabilis]
MEWDIAQAFQEELRCPICMETFIDPVTIHCGHSLCRPCLRLLWEEAETPARCPVCRQPSQQEELKTNIALQSLVSISRQISLRQFLSSEEHTCCTHKETKQMFCEVDKSLLCPHCSPSREHEAHRHQPVDCIAADKRKIILKEMDTIWEKIQENQSNIYEKRNIINQWVWYMNLHREMTKDFYSALHLGLREEEIRLSEILKEKGRVIFLQLRTMETQMLQKSSNLRNIYQELMKIYQKLDLELLRHLEDTLERCESALVFMPQLKKPELSPPSIPRLMDNLNHYRVEITYCHLIQNHEESNYVALSGIQEFSSGKHYWELSVQGFSTWAVGVFRNSAIGSNLILNESEDIFLLFSGKGNIHYSIFTTAPLLPHFIERPVGRIGVFLDLENGNVSFVNATKNSFIWRYPTNSFQYPVKPCFFSW